MVSIAWNGSDLFQNNANDSGLYKPRFYEVALTGVPVYLKARYSSGNVILSWPLGTLLETSTLAGPWTTNNAASHYTNSPAARSRFYRVLVQ